MEQSHGPAVLCVFDRQGPRVHRSIRSAGCPRGLGPSVGLRRVRGGGSWGGGGLFRSVDRLSLASSAAPASSGCCRMASAGVVIRVSRGSNHRATPVKIKGPLGRVQGNRFCGQQAEHSIHVIFRRCDKRRSAGLKASRSRLDRTTPGRRHLDASPFRSAHDGGLTLLKRS